MQPNVHQLGIVEFEPPARAQKKKRRLVKKYAQTEAPRQPETAEVQPLVEVQPHAPKQKGEKKKKG